MNKIMTILIVSFAFIACPAFAQPVYFTDRASFDAATGGGLNFESFENDFDVWYAPVVFSDFTVEETGGLNHLLQARGTPWGAFGITDGTGALLYEDNGDSIATFFNFTIPITAFGIDIAANENTTMTMGGDVSDTLALTAVTPSFWGVVDYDGISSISFNASGSPSEVTFDAASYGDPTIVVEVDIKGGSCPNPFNPKSKGSVPIAIVGSGDYDVTQIDPDSIEVMVGITAVPVLQDHWILEDSTEPPTGDIEDCYDCFDADDPANFNCDLDPLIPGDDAYCGDGYMDLVVKVDAQALAAAIADEGGAAKDACIPLLLTGVTDGGVPIVGGDSILIIRNIAAAD